MGSLPPRFEWRVGMTPENQYAHLMFAQMHLGKIHLQYHRQNHAIATLGSDAKYGESPKPLTWSDRVQVLAVYPPAGGRVQVRVKRSKGQTVTLNAQQIMEAYEWQPTAQAPHATAPTM